MGILEAILLCGGFVRSVIEARSLCLLYVWFILMRGICLGYVNFDTGS